MKRLAVLVAVLAIAAVAAVAPPGAPTEAQANCFPETGFCITNSAFAEYFSQRGQVRTHGYPISRSFTLEGFEVQIFQRIILQMQGGTVARLNVLDPDIMPLTRANQSVFPAPDPNLAAQAPQVGSPEYARRAIEFIRSVSPETFQGLPVNFFSTFNTAVPAQAGTSADVQTLLNLEIWGLPTSQPAYDPGNQGFVYQRFQRGIMHFRAEVPVTEGILVGEYFKAVITARNLPPDLAEDMRNSRFLGQYNPAVVNAVNRPAELQNTNMTGAFEPGTAAVTPGTGTPPGGTTPPPAGPATPTATPVPGDAPPTVTFNINDENRRVNFGQTIRVEIIAQDDKGLDRIEFEGEVSANDNGNDNASVAGDPAFQRRIFEEECDDRTVCAVVFDITPQTSGTFTLVARARDTARQTTETTIDIRVRQGVPPTTAPGPAPAPPPAPAPAPAPAPPPQASNCDPSYPDVCIPPPPPNLNCADIPHRRLRVLPPDPHRFDGDRDGVGCER